MPQLGETVILISMSSSVPILSASCTLEATETPRHRRSVKADAALRKCVWQFT